MHIISGVSLLLVLNSLSSSQGVELIPPCASSTYPFIPANLTDQDYITTIFAFKDDPQWCRNSSNFNNPFNRFLCIPYVNTGECKSCVKVCELDEEECASVWRCGRFPQTTDRAKLNVTFYMVHTNESAYRPMTTQSPKTIQNLTISNTTQISATPNSHSVLTSTEKPSWPSGEQIAGSVVGAFVVLALIVLGVLLLVRYGIPNFRNRQCEYQRTRNGIHDV